MAKEHFLCPNCQILSFGDVEYIAGFRRCHCQMCGYVFSHFAKEEEDELILFRKNKKRTNVDTEEIKDLIQSFRRDFDDKISALQTEKDKLHRIVKYSSDKPTYKFGEKLDPCILYNGNLSTGNTLWMYIDKEEYKIYLDELNSVRPNKSTCNFEVKNNLAYFNIVGESRMETTMHFNFVVRRK